jgi:predicted nucleic acid-binding protein
METQGDGLIVVDTNIIVYLLIKGEQTARVRQLLERDPEWAAPSFWRVEFLNVLMNYAKYQKMPAEAVRAVWEASYHLPHLREESVEGAQVLDLALKHDLGGYDALFALLAKNLRTVCVTQDKAFRKAIPQFTTSLDEFLK